MNRLEPEKATTWCSISDADVEMPHAGFSDDQVARNVTITNVSPLSCHGHDTFLVAAGTFEEMKASLIREAYRRHGSYRKAAAALGVARSTFGAWYNSAVRCAPS